ncbi:MAG: ABC transporter ATP-binding protein [Lachnospiraceae bacterium]|nr:ABC transporter ATP-binding protein [Lachnospiraceae bacterium]
MEHITIRNISREYGQGESAVKALDDVSLDISKGEVCVILGPSGSGKSTLLNMIGGLDRVDSGSITVDGLEITSLNKKQLTDYRREKLGMVFQAYNLIPELNVIENVRVVKDIAKEPLDETELLQVLGLEKYMTHFPSELSGGQQQRCSIARALVKNPALLLCDELTGALDSASTREVLKVLQAINERYNTTIIMITHDERISGMADRLVRLRDGKVVENTVKTKLKAEELGI